MATVEVSPVSGTEKASRIDFSPVWREISRGIDPQKEARERLSSAPDYATRVELCREMAAGALLPQIAPMLGVWPNQSPADEGVRGKIEDLAKVAASMVGNNPESVQDESRKVGLEALMRWTIKNGNHAAVQDEMSDRPAMLGLVAGLTARLANRKLIPMAGTLLTNSVCV